jgi:hypothetical protein
MSILLQDDVFPQWLRALLQPLISLYGGSIKVC